MPSQRTDRERHQDRQGEVEPDDLHQHRRVAEEFDERRRRPVEDASLRIAAEADHQAEAQAGDQADGEDVQGAQRTR
jgi:hypothetical protein